MENVVLADNFSWGRLQSTALNFAPPVEITDAPIVVANSAILEFDDQIYIPQFSPDDEGVYTVTVERPDGDLAYCSWATDTLFRDEFEDWQ